VDPIFVILYAVAVTLLLTLVLPRLTRSDQASPGARRLLWILAIAGLAGLFILVVLMAIL